MSDMYQPNDDFRKKAHLKSIEEYQQTYEQSITDPETFWEEKADGFHWFKRWDTVCSYNYDMRQGPISIKWFEGGKTNIVYNCVDRHLDTRGDQKAIIWEGNEPGEDGKLTYRELHEQVCKFANVLKSRGVQKGDRVSIYLPMIP
ncbi:MAG TPA: acetyl-coenzyme A synthetase, partial [Candidatus Latescibacteria bacterium]|nr:acetyl-coenzyme A synthetase [Candidatus Latescibacterota bacterium]